MHDLNPDTGFFCGHLIASHWSVIQQVASLLRLFECLIVCSIDGVK